MLNIGGRIYVTMKVDGKDLPSSPGLIERITMTEGMGALTPAIELILNDYAGSLSKELALTDGNELTITVGKTPEDINTQTRKYRVFGMRTLTTPIGPRMQVVGIHNAPSYLTGSVRESFKATTSEVIKTIAGRCGLSYYGPENFNGSKTNDSQVWMNIAKSRAAFVQQMTRSAYINDHSAMFCTLTSLGQLRYMNLNDVIATPKEKIKRMFAHNTYVNEDKSITTYSVQEAKTRSSAGLMNTWQNYGSTRVEHQLSGEEKSHSKVEVQTTADYLAINNTVKKNVQRSRLEYSPLDCGNTHKNFVKAQYQNVKLIGLFSEHVSVLTFDVTDLQPLDVVIYRQANADPKVPVSNSDIYMVIGKSILVKAGNYAERIELVRHNIVEKGAAELTSFEGSSTAAADSVIPNSQIDPTSKMGAEALPKAQTLNDMTKPTEKSFSSLKGSVSDMRKAAGFASTSLKAMHDTLNTVKNAKDSAKMMVAQAKNSVNSLKHYSQMGKAYVNGMKNSVDNLRNMRETLKPKNLSAAVRSTLMFKSGGSLNAITHNLGVVREGMQLSRMLQPINYALDYNANEFKSIAGGERAINEFRMYSNEIINNSANMRIQTNHMWNESAAILHGVDVPEKFASSNPSRMTDVMTDLYRAPASGSSIAVSAETATQDFGNALMRRTADRQVAWIDPNAEWDYDASVARERTSRGQSYDTSPASANAAYKDYTGDHDAAESRDAELG